MNDLPFYLWLDDKQAGPYTLVQLRGMWTHGVITGDQLFWQEGNNDWQSLAHTPELVSSLSALPVKNVPPLLAWRGLLTLVGVLLILVVALAVASFRRSLRAASPAQAVSQASSSPLPTPTPAPVSVADLEKTYREAATTLQDQLRAALAQETTQARLLGRAREEEVQVKKLQAIDARRNGSFLAPQPGETLLDVRLVDMTDQPPLLNEDASDLYHRYKSVLKFQTNIEAPNDSGSGKHDMFLFPLELPVVADRSGKWEFPTTEGVLQRITQECDQRAKGYWQWKAEEILKRLHPDD